MSSLNPREDDAKFCNFSKRPVSGHIEQEVVQKRFLKCPKYSVYHAAIQIRGEALFWDSDRNSQGFTGEVRRSRAARSFRIVKFSRTLQGIYFVL